MSEFNLLEEVKKSIGLGGNDYHDQTIQSYIDEVKQYLLDGGCKPKVVNSPSSAGLIARGAWIYGHLQERQTLVHILKAERYNLH